MDINYIITTVVDIYFFINFSDIFDGVNIVMIFFNIISLINQVYSLIFYLNHSATSLEKYEKTISAPALFIQ